MKYLTLFSVLMLFSCFQQSNNDTLYSKEPTVDAFWRTGLAEINTYECKRLRYGEYREVEAIMIFVSEPFSKSKQVKMDDYQSNPSDYIEVLKMNYSEKFQTGVYPYSIFTSSFLSLYEKGTPCLKSTTSIQEWCGHIFSQVNKKGNGYKGKSYSYFESDGDENFSLKADLIEDELFSKIRLQSVLPVGTIQAVPNAIYSRLYHKPYKNYSTEATLSKISLSKNGVDKVRMKYTLLYKELNRRLSVYFTQSNPVAITSWIEEDIQTNEVISEGKLKQTKHLDYWRRNAVKDSVYLDTLGLN